MGLNQDKIKRGNLRIELLSVLLLFSSSLGYAQTPEAEVKAVAFQKLSLFIEWPAHALDTPGKDFIIGVIGKSPFGDILESVYESTLIKGRKVKIVYFKDVKQLTLCHMLFITSDVGKQELPRILDAVRGKPVLTIAESEGYAEEGCFINFFELSGKLRFEINQKAIESSGFVIDFKLLSVSKIVTSHG
ncbi:MAG TPA: YfiR family protein [Bacteroidales bacterium]|nr:YfiR family protein [Bacteroidales bacterium]